ncbi:MAG: tetratricopeptide repeat protein [Bdellovibrionaceae bacterium]|nr:tetratricopeptide repeat protein [Pseudobdellovibrionaceae bacterium]
MKTKPILLASVLMTISCCLGLWQYEKVLSRQDEVQLRVDKMAQNFYDEKLKNEMILARLEEFRQEVALQLPGEKFPFQLEESLRNLASVIPHQKLFGPSQVLAAKKLLDEGRLLLADKKFEDATKVFLDLLSRYPESSLTLEASYNLIQCFYVTGNKQEALVWSEKMLSQFPESLWTARAMLVTADIYADQNRKNDAIDVYQIILDTFKDQEIRDEVQKRITSAGQ